MTRKLIRATVYIRGMFVKDGKALTAHFQQHEQSWFIRTEHGAMMEKGIRIENLKRTYGRKYS